MLYLSIALFVINVYSQENKKTFTQFDLSIPLQGNPNRNEINEYNNEKGSFFIPDGFGAKIGYGFHHKEWVAIGLHTGIDWKMSVKLVTLPVFINLKLTPKISHSTRLAIQAGLGKATAIGRGDLFGTYQKISLGVQTDEGLIIFIEVSDYKLKLNNNQNYLGSVSFGIALVTF